MKLSERDLGGKFIALAMLLWLSVSVGPWWIGLILFLFGMIVSLAIKLDEKR